MNEPTNQPTPTRSNRRGWATRAAIATLIPAALLLVAACGSSSASGSGSSPSSTSSRGSGFEAYRQCLEQNGVTLPSQSARPSGSAFPRPSGSPRAGFPGGTGGNGGGFPGGGFGGGGLSSTTPPTGVSASAWAAAQQACASVRPTAGANGGAAGSTAFNAYISCLSDNGVKISTTSPRALGSLDQTNATVKKALATCKPLLPQRGSGGAPRVSATPSA